MTVDSLAGAGVTLEEGEAVGPPSGMPGGPTATGADPASVPAGADVTAAPPASSTWLGAQVAAALSLLAGAIHLYVTPEHLREWWLFGAFFALVTIAQVVLAGLVVLRPGTRTLLAGIWGNVAVIGIYLASRTVGLPIGPPEHATGANGHTLAHLPVVGGIGNGQPIMPGTDAAAATHLEGVGMLDLSALGAELLLVGVLVVMLPQRHRRITLNACLALGVIAWGTRLAAMVAS